MRKLVTFTIVCLFCGWMFSSCEQAIEENIGNSYILMSRSNQTIAFADTIKVAGSDTLFSSLKDTIIQSIGVYRSGLSSSYPEINLKVKIDSVYLKSLIQQANDPSVPDVNKSSTVLNYKNSVLLPAICYKLTPDVKIKSGEMVGNVTLQVVKSKFARIRTDKVFLPVSIDTTTVKGVNKDLTISVLQMKNSFVFKKN
jgi:hypothetical protein